VTAAGAAIAGAAQPGARPEDVDEVCSMAQLALSNVQKVATLLVALGPEHAATVLSHLEAEQVSRVIKEIAALGAVPNQTRRAVLREFRRIANHQEQQHENLGFVREMVGKAWGDERAQEMLAHIQPAVAPAGPAYLTTIAPQRAAELLQGEPVHIAALLLVALPPDRAATILAALPMPFMGEVTERLRTTVPPAPEVRAYLERALRAKASRHRQDEQVNGRQILQKMVETAMATPSAPEESVTLPPITGGEDRFIPSSAEPERVEFSALEHVEAAVLQAVLRQADLSLIFCALRGADLRLRERMLAALPFNRRMAILGRLRAQTPVSLRQIAEAQQRVLQIWLAQRTLTERTVVRRTSVHA
jgi:flagellar motor switch protein FliG